MPLRCLHHERPVIHYSIHAAIINEIPSSSFLTASTVVNPRNSDSTKPQYHLKITMLRQVQHPKDCCGLATYCHRMSRSTHDQILFPDLGQVTSLPASKGFMRTLPIPHLPSFTEDRSSHRIENVGQWPMHVGSGPCTQEPLHWYPQSRGLSLMLPPIILSPILPSAPPPSEPSKAEFQSRQAKNAEKEKVKTHVNNANDNDENLNAPSATFPTARSIPISIDATNYWSSRDVDPVKRRESSHDLLDAPSPTGRQTSPPSDRMSLWTDGMPAPLPIAIAPGPHLLSLPHEETYCGWTGKYLWEIDIFHEMYVARTAAPTAPTSLGGDPDDVWEDIPL